MQSILVMGDGALANGVGDTLVGAGREIRRLREEINLLNLMNGMHFTPDQLKATEAAARKAAAWRNPRPDWRQLEAGRKLLKALKEILAVVEGGRAVSSELHARIANLNSTFRGRNPGENPDKKEDHTRHLPWFAFGTLGLTFHTPGCLGQRFQSGRIYRLPAIIA